MFWSGRDRSGRNQGVFSQACMALSINHRAECPVSL